MRIDSSGHRFFPGLPPTLHIRAAHHDAHNQADDRCTEEYLQVQPGQQTEREETPVPEFPGGSDRCCKSIEEYTVFYYS